MRMSLALKIWLAVVAAITVVSMAFVIVARQQTQPPSPAREVLIRNEAGEIIGQSDGRPVRVPGQGLEIAVPLQGGGTLYVLLPPRRSGPGEGPPPPPPFLGPRADPTRLLWLLGLIALATAVATWPIVRGLTRRLDTLREGVDRWGQGDLRARVALEGTDEAGELAQHFNSAADRVESLVGSHRALLANASHELRSPLARLRMAVALQQTQPSEALRTEVDASIRELDALIDEILLASRLSASEGGVARLPRESVDWVGIAAEECARLSVPLDVQGLGADEPVPLIDGVPRLAQRLVRNLLTNAVRHGIPAGQGVGADPLIAGVQAHIQVQPQALVLTVRDRGPGIPPDLREAIFEPFFRLPGRSERDGSVGLGLALVRSIAQEHGATVLAQDPGDGGPGVAFVVTLPR